MFQNFDDASDPSLGPARVRALRQVLKRRKLDAYLIPRGDEHRSEYVAQSAERLRWLTGFSGSAGFAVVLADAAALFVDGRYILQVRQQVDLETFEIFQIPDATAQAYLMEKLKEGATVGYDPRLHSSNEVERLSEALKIKEITTTAIEANLIDPIWDRTSRSAKFARRAPPA